MNPVMARPAWELAPGAQTSPQALEAARALATALGREVIQVGDGAGFVINRLLMQWVNEATALLAERRADAATIDRAMTRCLGHPTGPLATADMIGLDVVLDSLQVLCEHTDPLRYRPHPLLIEMVRAGHLGQKSGRGFFTYQ
jgi:3-hydroxyacyl-CoA dehydrogenase